MRIIIPTTAPQVAPCRQSSVDGSGSPGGSPTDKKAALRRRTKSFGAHMDETRAAESRASQRVAARRLQATGSSSPRTSGSSSPATPQRRRSSSSVADASPATTPATTPRRRSASSVITGSPLATSSPAPTAKVAETPPTRAAEDGATTTMRCRGRGLVVATPGCAVEGEPLGDDNDDDDALEAIGRDATLVSPPTAGSAMPRLRQRRMCRSLDSFLGSWWRRRSIGGELGLEAADEKGSSPPKLHSAAPSDQHTGEELLESDSLMAADVPEQLSWRASYAVGATPSPEVPRSRRKVHGVWMDLEDDD